MDQRFPRPTALAASSSLAAARIAGGLVLALAAYLRFSNLGADSLGNTFYAAAVRSMSGSLHNFFFVSFDPAGTYMVDKPPLALWLQTLSTLAFGYSGFSLMLPQALAGVAAVGLLFLVVRALHQEATGLVAALVLASLPASVLVSRNNTMDTIVMFLSVAALLATWRAVETRRVWPLALAGLLVGLAFNTKGFEAFVALPGIVAYFWLASTTGLGRRFAQLAVMGIIVVVVGLSWVAAVSLFPEDQRPLVLNSEGNSIWDLTFGYNGLDRISGRGAGFDPATALTSGVPGVVPFGVMYGGETGYDRVLNEFPGPLVAAALPVALAGASLLASDLLDRRKRGVAALWLLWLGAGLVVFSASRLGSAHYIESFSPAVAACFGVAAWAAVIGPWWRRVAALAGCAGSAVYALDRLTQMGDAGAAIEMLAYATLALCLLVLAAMVVRRPLPALALLPFAAVAGILFALSLVSIREAPTEGRQPGLVFLTLDESREARFDPASRAYAFFTGRYGYPRSLVDFAGRREDSNRYIFATRSFAEASSLISEFGVPALPVYSEFVNRLELPRERLAALLEAGELAYYAGSLRTLGAFDAEAARLLLSYCPSEQGALAGVSGQAGFQLFACR